MDLHLKENDPAALWQVPYLLIDPEDIGRDYEAIIRINSQSGKGGVAYILSREFGLDLPKEMHPEVGLVINNAADQDSRELSSDEVYTIFQREYVNLATPLELIAIEREDFSKTNEVGIEAQVKLHGNPDKLSGRGNGPISAFVDALRHKGQKNFTLLNYRQHSIGRGSNTNAAAYIEIKHDSGTVFYGCGIDTSIEVAGLHALVSAFNRACNSNTST